MHRLYVLLLSTKRKSFLEEKFINSRSCQKVLRDNLFPLARDVTLSFNKNVNYKDVGGGGVGHTLLSLGASWIMWLRGLN